MATKAKKTTKAPTPVSVLKRLIPLADRHQKADEYRAGHYWQGNGSGTGCAVGCTIHDAIKLGVLPQATSHESHASIAKATGLPEMVWRLADNIFEGLPEDDRPAWTPRLLRAAAKCKNLERVPALIMTRLAERLAADAIRDDVKAVTLVVAGLWRRRANGDEPDAKEWDAAWQQAYAARQQADAAWRGFWKWCADVVCKALMAA